MPSTTDRYTPKQIRQALSYIEMPEPGDEVDCGKCGYHTCRAFAIAMLDGVARPSMCSVFTQKVIAKLKNKERELREALFFQQTILDAIPLPVYYETLEGRLSGCNLAFEELIGRSQATLKGEPPENYLPGSDLARLSKMINYRLSRQTGRQIVDIFITDGTGERRRFELHKALYTARSTEPSGYIAALVDITERENRAAELQLAKKSAELAVQLLRRLPSGFVIVDRDLQILESNEPFAAALGEDITALYEAIPGLKGADLKSLFVHHALFTQLLASGEESHSKDIDLQGRHYKLSLYSIVRGDIVGAVLLDLTAPDVIKDEVHQRVEDVLRQHLYSVQKIAQLLGENAAHTETGLRGLMALFTDVPHDNV